MYSESVPKPNQLPTMSSFTYLFDPTSYAANDMPAKLAISGWLSSKGFTVDQNPDEMGVDLIVTSGGAWRADVEVEIRHSRAWGRNQRFPFSDHQTSIRKHRLLHSGNYLCTLNESLTNGILTPMTGSYRIVSKQVVDARGGEKFFAFDLTASRFVRLG